MKAYGFRHGIAAALLGVFLLAGCEDAFKSQEPENLENFSPEEIFKKAEIELNKKRYDQGAQYFSEIERLYPYSEWAKRGLIMQAFVYHQGKKYDESRAAAQRYVDFFPADEDAAYAQYLLALSYYDQISDIGRDQGLTLQALETIKIILGEPRTLTGRLLLIEAAGSDFMEIQTVARTDCSCCGTSSGAAG